MERDDLIHDHQYSIAANHDEEHGKAIRKTISPRVWQKCLDNYPKKDNKCIATYEIIVLRAQKKLPKHAIDPSSISRSTT